jgi:hypothetical protein
MEKLIILGITYAAYLTMLFTAKKLETRRAIAISFTLISVILSGFLFFGGVIFVGSVLAALAVALLSVGCLLVMIWVPYMFRQKLIQE